MASLPPAFLYQNCAQNLGKSNSVLDQIVVHTENFPPTQISLSRNSYSENIEVGAKVAEIEIEDEDSSNHILVLVDNSNTFKIENKKDLVLKTQLDYEELSTYNIKITAIDEKGLSLSEFFELSVLNEPEAPHAIEINFNALAENSPENTVVATVAVLDEDSSSHTISINGAEFLKSSGNSILVKDPEDLNYEVNPTLEFKVRATDGDGLYIEKNVSLDLINLDEGPSDIALSNTALVENSVPGTVIGNLSVDGLIVGDLSFELLNHQTQFVLNGSQLQTVPGSSFNYELKNTYALSVKATDQSGEEGLIKEITINITDVDEGPSGIVLSQSSINENSAAGTEVGTLSATGAIQGNVAFTILDSPSKFVIDGQQLKTAPGSSFDFEDQSSYSVNIRASDASGDGEVSEVKVISVIDLDEGPDDILISASDLLENSPPLTHIGNLSVSGLIVGTVSYELLTHGDLFTLSGNQLKTASGSSFDYETKQSYTLSVKATDESGEVGITKSVVINISDVNELPSDFNFQQVALAENSPENTLAGSFTVTDSNSASHTIEILDSIAFKVSGKNLFVNDSGQLNFEISPIISFSARVTNEHGFSITRVFQVSLGDVDEGPSDIILSSSSFPENITPLGKIADISSTGLITGAVSYALVGSAEKFEIVGNSLKTKSSAVFDYERQNTYQITISALDESGEAAFEKSFTLFVSDVSEIPTDIVLSNNSIDENSPKNTLIAKLTATDSSSSSHTYTLLSGSAFKIIDNELLVSEPSQLNFEHSQSHNISVKVTNHLGGEFTKNFTIFVNNVSEGVTMIMPLWFTAYRGSPKGSVVAEFEPSGNIVGHVSYTLLNQNNKYEIIGNQLVILDSSALGDAEYGYGYDAIRVQAVDESGEPPYNEEMIAAIQAIVPTNIALTNNSVDENSPLGTVIGEFESDVLFDLEVIYEFNSDYPDLAIEGNKLLVNTADLDYEYRKEYKIYIRARTAGETSYRLVNFTITINDLDDAPKILLSGARQVKEFAPGYTKVGELSLSYTDPRFPNPRFTILSSPEDSLYLRDNILEVTPYEYGKLDINVMPVIHLSVRAWDDSYYGGTRPFATQDIEITTLAGEPPEITPVAPITFLIDDTILATQTENEIKTNLQGYVDDINHIFSKNTERVFSFDPDTGVEFYTHDENYSIDYNSGVTPGYAFTVQIINFGGTLIASSASGRRGKNEVRAWLQNVTTEHKIYSREEVQDQIDQAISNYDISGELPYFNYMYQLFYLLHEVGHNHGLAFGEYYQYNEMFDATGVEPDLSWGCNLFDENGQKVVDQEKGIGFILSPLSYRYYWKKRFEVGGDPMGPGSSICRGDPDYPVPKFDPKDMFDYSPMGAALINKIASMERLGNDCWRTHCLYPRYDEPNPVTVHVSTLSTGTPVAGCEVTAYWNGYTIEGHDQRTKEYSTGVIGSSITDEAGEVTFNLTNHMTSHGPLGGSPTMVFFKSVCDGYQPAGDAMTRFDQQAGLHAPNGIGFEGGFTTDMQLKLVPTQN